MFQIVVTSTNDVLTKSLGGSGSFFFGATDLSDIVSISITNLGTSSSISNFGLDNVTTIQASDQTPTSVPEPSSFVLLGGGLFAMWLARRRLKAA
jgi:hypothetical protein